MTSERVRGIKSQNIRAVLCELGLTGESAALDQLVCVVLRAHEDVYLLSNVRGLLFPSVAQMFDGLTVRSLERNMAEILDFFWAKGNPERLQKMAGYELVCRPTTGEFADIVRRYMEDRGLLKVLY